MAEALLQRIDSEHFEAVSAATSWGRLHPFTVEVMKEIGIDLSQKAPKRMKDVTDDNFDYVITLDENSRCLTRNFRAETIHWQLDNPITESGDPDRQLRSF